MKSFICLILSLFIFQTHYSQSHPQLRLKTGFSGLFPSPGGKGYAFQTTAGATGSVVLGGEYSHPFKNGKGAWHIGFTFQDGENNPAPNKKNLIPVNLAPPAFAFTGAPAKTVVYVGIEKYIKRDYSKPSKNYFSVVAGLGLGFTMNKFGDWKFSKHEKYETRTGGIVEGYTSDFVKPSFPVAASLYGGLRYNITNKKGNEVLILELIANYGLTPVFKQTVDYTLNGNPQQDRLKEKGFCMQFNILVPLHTFFKRK